jgi:flagellar FliL protein
MMTLLLCGVVTAAFAVAAVVGTVMYLSKQGKLGGTAAAAPVADSVKTETKATTHPKALEPMLINLADEGGHAYLRLGVVLAEEDEPGAKAKEEGKPVAGADAAVRDTIFEVLGRETSDKLLAADGKEKLKAELMTAIADYNPEMRVKTIYFTEFLVQR